MRTEGSRDFEDLGRSGDTPYRELPGLGPAFGVLPVNPLGLALHLPSSTLHISKTSLSSLTPTAIEGGL